MKWQFSFCFEIHREFKSITCPPLFYNTLWTKNISKKIIHFKPQFLQILPIRVTCHVTAVQSPLVFETNFFFEITEKMGMLTPCIAKCVKGNNRVALSLSLCLLLLELSVTFGLGIVMDVRTDHTF